MGSKKLDYVQITVRLPPKLYNLLSQYAENRTLTIQDAILVILLNSFDMVEVGQ